MTATCDLEEVRSYRSQASRGAQAIEQPSYERIEANMSLSNDANDYNAAIRPSVPVEVRYHLPEEEISLGPACWLWDYLRRSKQAGFFIPLSGGIDSCATSVVVHSMCRLVYHDVALKQDPQVLKDLLWIVGEPSTSEWRPASPQDIAGRLFHSAYMGMASNSGPETRQRARDLAKAIGAYHVNKVLKRISSLLI